MTDSDEQAYYPEELITAVKRFIQKALFQSILKVPFWSWNFLKFFGNFGKIKTQKKVNIY